MSLVRPPAPGKGGARDGAGSRGGAEGLLLDIGPCLRLFGGLERLAGAVAADLEAQGLAAGLAVAPTPQGAFWLAGTGRPPPCPDLPALRAALDALPVAALDLPAAVAAQLESFGTRRLADLRRLPRAALGRRIGAATLARVARAYGELPDPRQDFPFPPRFEAGLDLPAPTDQAAALVFAGRRLTAALAGWLEAGQAGVAQCLLQLAHRGRPATGLPLRFASATRDPARLERVLRERLERLPLPAAVEGLLLAADRVVALPGRSGGLFDSASGGGMDGEAMAALVERLRARLGEERIHGLAVAAEHRPECATRRVPEGCRPPAPVPAAARPFWLLARPRALAEVGGRPWYRGPLHLLAGPERLESGWWDGGEEGPEGGHGGPAPGDLRRDYFVALTADTRWAWVFRELRPPGGWFLHGWFA